jgi:hypothetical protein
MCEAHDSILGGHNAAHKTYLKISTSYFWPKMRQDIEQHQSFCLRCQRRKKSTNKKTPLAPLPIPDRSNLRIHADLFGPTLTADSNKKFALCITDAFTMYAVVTVIANFATLSTNFRLSCSSYSMSTTQKHHQRIRSEMRGSICFKNYEPKHIEVQLNMDSNQKIHLIKIRCPNFAAQLALLMLKEEGGSSDFETIDPRSSDFETIDSLCSEPCPSFLCL